MLLTAGVDANALNRGYRYLDARREALAAGGLDRRGGNFAAAAALAADAARQMMIAS